MTKANTLKERECAHCGEPVPASMLESSSADAGDGALCFCCVGCEAVYHALHEAGFDDFYRFSAIPVGGRLQSKPSVTTPATIPAQILAKEATVCEDGSLELMLGVDGIHCAGCVWFVCTGCVHRKVCFRAGENPMGLGCLINRKHNTICKTRGS